MNFFDYSCLTNKLKRLFIILDFSKNKLSLAVYGIFTIYMSKEFTLRASHLGRICCVASRSR